MEQTIVFTALPKSFDPNMNKLRVSAHVAPRLDVPGDGTLSTFGDWLDWPAKEIDWFVKIGGGAELPAVVVTDPPARSDLWTSLFDGTTFVRSRKDVDTLVDWKVLSYPAGKIFDFIRTRYTQLAQTSFDDHPDYGLLRHLFGAIGVASRDQIKELVDPVANDLDEELEATRRNTFDNPYAPPMRDFVALKRFLDRGPVDHAFEKNPDGTFKAWKPIKPPELDFHQALTLVGGHPRAQRLLGLVVDLEVSLDEPPPSPTDVQVIPSWTSSLGDSSHDVKPRTRCLVPGGPLFFAQPAGELQDGHLPIGGSPYQALQVDVDGGGLKLMNFADNLKRSRLFAHNTDDTPERYSVPALRSGGISVVRDERGDQVVLKLDKGDGLNSAIVAAATTPPAADPFLDAEEVTRGYYVDVWDAASEEWHALARRVGSIRFTDIPEDIEVKPEHLDEAAVTTTPTSSSDPNAPKEMYLQQSLFHWRGWSLAAAQPGKHLQEDGTVEPPPAPPNPFPLAFDYQAAPKSLPRLRFGVEYRLRMRAADIAGNSVPFDLAAAKDDPQLVAVVPFARFEPVPSPEVIPRAPRTEGESDIRVVIRSNFDADASGPSERHIAPAKTSQRMAEHHGMFDVGSPSTLDKSKYGLIVAREDKTFTDVGAPDPSDPEGSVFVSAPMLPLPYLPDPFARGAAFLGLPGASGVQTYVFGEDAAWPDYEPIRLVIEEPPAPNQLGPAAPPQFAETTSPRERVLRVQLPKADVVRVRLSSTLLPDDLAKLGIWGWTAGTVPDQVALEGQHWMVTPFRILTLVHAVRQPLATPEFQFLGVSRSLGQTFAVLHDRRLKFSRKSTGKLELFATWDEHVDLGPGEPAPTVRHVERSFALRANLERHPDKPGAPLPDDHMVLDERHEFHDTIHRDVTYRGVATSKFTEYFTQRASLTIQSVPTSTVLDTAGEGLMPGSVSVRDASGVVYAQGSDYQVDDATGTVTFGAASLAGKQVRLAYVSQPVSRETGPPPEGNGPKSLNVPSSSRPASPKVLYVVPTFRWKTGPGRTSTRLRGGLRIYLERPWWSSGDGELLGVVVFRGDAFNPSPRLVPYITQWGLDPLFSGPPLPERFPTVDRFTLSQTGLHGSDLRLDEVPLTVHVAGHTVEFDGTRDLYYCDVDVDVGSAYMPFVRLALCRYQPSSVEDAHLSRVVLADYAQLAPDRATSVVFAGRSLTQLHASLSGISYAETATRPGPGEARATVEERNFALDEEVGWTPVISDVVMEPMPGRGGTTVWTADLTLPHPRSEGRYRLVLEQFEVLPTGERSHLLGGEMHRLRLVHQDILPL
jgi:hypothetical protein